NPREYQAMNKIYKLIWNQHTKTFVVASELASARGKRSASAASGSSQRKRPSRLVGALAGVGLLGLALTGSPAFAATCSEGDDHGNSTRVACGTGADASEDWSTAVGSNAQA